VAFGLTRATRILKVAGRGEGLDALRQALGARFDRKPKKEGAPVSTDA